MVTRRHLIAGSLAATATASLGACGHDSGSNQGSSSAYHFSYLRPVWGPATFTKNGPYQKELERRAKVKIDAEIIPVFEYDDKVNARLAGGDIPDVIWGQAPLGGAGGQNWRDVTDQGAFQPINEFLDKFTAVRDAVPKQIWDMLRAKDGKNYFVPNLIWPQVPFFSFYRKDLFDKAGIDEPTTVDQLLGALRAVKREYPKMIPLTMPDEWYTKELATSFDLIFQGWELDTADPSKIVPWWTKESQIDFYLWLQNLHREELLDPGFRVDDPNAAFDKFKGAKSAVLLGHWGQFPDLQSNLIKLEKSAKVGVMPPLGPKGCTRQVFPVDRGFYVSSKIKEPERFFEFLEWTLTDGNDFRKWGVKGEMYKETGGKKVTIPDSDRKPGFQGPQLEPLSFIGPFSEKLDWENTKAGYEAAGVGDFFDYVKGRFEEVTAKFRSDIRIPTTVSATEDKSGAQLQTDILQPLWEGTIIDHGITKDDWLTADSKWRAGGGDAIIAEVNQAQKERSEPDYTQA